MTAVKICGLTSATAIGAINKSGVEYAGFVYFPASARHLTFPRMADLAQQLSSSVDTVCVLVDPDDALVETMLQSFQPKYIQLHGKETPDRLTTLRKKHPSLKLIKAITLREADDVTVAMPYESCADMLLFDAKPPISAVLPGGNGLPFDWTLLANRQFSIPWMLSGGLTAENVQEAIRISGTRIVDVSSSVESAPGVKDGALIQSFVQAARAA